MPKRFVFNVLKSIAPAEFTEAELNMPPHFIRRCSAVMAEAIVEECSQRSGHVGAPADFKVRVDRLRVSAV
jgi:hypothetical protein